MTRPGTTVLKTLQSPTVRRALVVFVVALSIRILYAALIAQTGCLAINEDPISDMETFHRWALRIVQGDWLGLGDFHPYHPWQRAIAPESVWLEWYGNRVFHQDPLYVYLVAAVYLVAPREPSSVVLLQFLLGAITAGGVCLLGERLLGARAGLGAGLLAACYGPLLFYESLLLRDTLLVSLTTAFLLVLEEARERSTWIWWLGTGSLAGAIYLTKPNVALYLPVLALWMASAARIPRSRRAVASLACGFALTLAPVIVRNLAVGAPAFKTTTRGAIEFINGNNPYHPGIGWFDGDDQRVAAYARETMQRTRGRLLPTVRVVLETWRGRLGGFLALQAKKLGYLLAPFEMPNNASYAYFRMNSPVLGSGLPTFFLVSPLAALGLALTASMRRRLLPHYLFLGVGFASTVGFYVIARFRIPYLPLLLVFAGGGLSALLGMARDRRWKSLAGSAAILIVLLSLNSRASYPDTDLVRPQDFLISSNDYEERGRVEDAKEELDRGRRIFPAFVPLHVRAGQLFARSGDIDGALAAFREALRFEPGSRRIQEAIRALEDDPARLP